MSDPKATKMTLEEAERITRVERETYADREWLSQANTRGERSANEIYTEAHARWDRARAIVDAAVEAHEARLALEAFPGDPADTGFDWHTEPLWEASHKADAKLRALERGEDPKP